MNHISLDKYLSLLYIKEAFSILGIDQDPPEIYLMFLSREIDIKLCQIYTKG